MNGTPPKPAEIISRSSGIQFARQEVPPPAPLYLGPDDHLGFTVWNSVAALTIAVRGRWMTPDGVPRMFSFEITPASDRSESSMTFALGEGFLLSATIAPSPTPVRRGQCYALLQLGRGVSTQQVATGLLAQGYVVSGNRIAWPLNQVEHSVAGRGMPRTITGTDPAAGVEISETVPTNARWRVLGVTATLVTAVAVANRQVSLVFDDGANVYARMPFTAVQPASLTTVYSWSAAGDPASASNVARSMPLNANPLLFQAHRMRTVTDLLQAGDNWSAPVYLVEEWIED